MAFHPEISGPGGLQLNQSGVEAIGFADSVARLEINILFEELINRFSHVRLVGSPDRDLKQLNFYAWENVQVIFS